MGDCSRYFAFGGARTVVPGSTDRASLFKNIDLVEIFLSQEVSTTESTCHSKRACRRDSLHRGQARRPSSNDRYSTDWIHDIHPKLHKVRFKMWGGSEI